MSNNLFVNKALFMRTSVMARKVSKNWEVFRGLALKISAQSQPIVNRLISSSAKMSQIMFSDGSSVRPILFEKIGENGFRPTRASKFAAGYDLYSAYDCVVPKRGKQLVKTDIRVAVPHGCYGRIAPRSGLAWKHSIDVGAGVVDSDYRGNVGVILFNHSDQDFAISRGDRIAQLIPEMIADTELVEAKLDSTDRQEGGFGSTGISLNNENIQNN